MNKEINEVIKKCVVYCRVSDQDQLKGISLKVQQEACVNWAEKNSFKVLGVYIDEAKSGTKTAGRDGLDDALIHCDREHIDAILVIDTDRFARNEEDHFAIKAMLKKLDTRIVAINQPMIDESPEGKLMETVLIGINAFYSRLTGRKVKKSLEKKWEEGWWPGWAPLGYLNVNTGTEEHPNKIIDVDPYKGPLITNMFEMYSTGNYSILQLTKIMHEKGLTARKGKRICVSTAQQILANTFYYGLMKWTDKEKVGSHTPLISQSLFDQCQHIASKHRQFVMRIRKHTFLLRGIVRCPIHGKWLTAEWHHDTKKLRRLGGKIAYYHCPQRGGCSKSYIETTKLEKMIAKQIKKYEFSEKFINFVIEAVKKQVAEDRNNTDSVRQGLINQKKGIEAKRDHIENLLIDGTIDKNTYKRQHDQLLADITQIDIKISNLQSAYSLDIHLIEEILALTRNIYQTYLDAPDFLKAHLLRFFFEYIYIDDKKITKVIETPIFSTLRKENLLLIRTNWLPRVDSNHEPSS
ncbi:MAG: recombinase [Microgenomates group bacterium GW2011_GWC1_44_10]|nr:MAG: recombinase [Microgenomates group bacterium GW2011_GWC1_44_10]